MPNQNAPRQVGIFAFAYAAIRLGLARMPGNARTVQLWGVAAVGGIGFTVSLFNPGLVTAVIGPDFQALGLANGRTIAGNFIEFEMPFVPTNTTVVTIFAGGNEVNTITAALGNGCGG